MKKAGIRVFAVLLAGVLAVALIHCGGGGGGGGGGTTPLTAIDNTSQASQVLSSSNQAYGIGEEIALIGLMYAGVGMDYIPISSTLSALRESGRLSSSRIVSGTVFSRNPELAKGAELAARLRRSEAFRTVFGKARKAVSPSASGTVYSLYGGSYTYSYTEDATSYSLSITFVNYRESDSSSYWDEIDGTLTETGSFSESYNPPVLSAAGDFSNQLGASSSAPLTIKEYSSGFGSVRTQEEAYVRIEMGVDITYNEFTGDETIVVTCGMPSGTIVYQDFYFSPGYGFSIGFAGLSYAVTLDWDAATTVTTTTATFNGGTTVSITEPGLTQNVTVSYSNLRNEVVDGYPVYSDSRIDGTVETSFSPALSCTTGTFAGGRYTFATVTPVHYDYSLSRTTDGRITINSNVTIQYNPDGTVTVTVGGESDDFASDTEIMYFCTM